jgi:hypothetical protein
VVLPAAGFWGAKAEITSWPDYSWAASPAASLG